MSKEKDLDAYRTIETLLQCAELLLDLLKDTAAQEEAEEIYQEFFGE